MTHLKVWCVGVALAAVVASCEPKPARAQGVREYLRSWASEPPTLEDAARRIDQLQSCLANQGSVVVKQPDVWSQARMTKFRKEYENTMLLQLNKFSTILAARIARSDTATFSSQTSLAASLSPLAPGQSLQVTSGQVGSELNTATGLLNQSFPFPAPGQSGFPKPEDFTLLQAANPATGGATGLSPPSSLTFGLEPNIQNDQQGDYITHLQRLRRINLGDDNADSAGYGLYLVRVPVSITPGDCTKKGFGAVVNMTVSHDFGPRFLPSTYRNLVINDLIDQLSPVVYEMIRSGLAVRFHKELQNYYNPKNAPGVPKPSTAMPREAQVKSVQDAGNVVLQQTPALKDQSFRAIAAVAASRSVSRSEPRVYPVAPDDVNRVFGGTVNILNLAYATQLALGLVEVEGKKPPDFNTVHLTDIRSYLKQELGAAYDLMEGRCAQDVQPVLADVPYIEDLTEKVSCRKYEGPKGAKPGSLEEFSDFVPMYQGLTQRLPGNLHERPIGALCWAIAIDAGLLNRQLHEDMSETTGPDGWRWPPDAQHMAFYQPMPPPEVSTVFEQYVKARWPIITFALEPVIDEQNVDDAFTRRRDLQLALAFALASGRISFRQAINYTRTLQYESQTIALNQTVAAFAHGNDTFGWRISPRYQTPPEESNLRAITNLILRGGPGPNYQLNNSKIEPGIRELTAVVVMPSFVRGVRLDVANDWYKLVDPDDLKVRAVHSVEFGRKINEARDCLEMACQDGHYRAEDVQRLRVRLHQLEQLLPLQTQFVKVPYENTLGGFDLFTPGASALVPQLTGFYGVDYIDTSTAATAGCDLIVYGKHYNIYESHVNVGGKDLPAEGTGIVTATDATGKAVSVVNSVSPLRDASGNLLLLKPDGTTTSVADNGSFDIISREVMRVRIPKTLASQLAIVTKADGSQWVEISVSTPNGISNRLQVPVKPQSTTTTAGQAPGYTITTANTTVTLAYYLLPANNPLDPTAIVVGPNYKDNNTPDSIAIAPASLALVDPSPVDVKLEFSATTGVPLTAATVHHIAFDPSKTTYTLKTADLANALQSQAELLYYSAANPKPSSITTTSSKITVTPTPNPTINPTDPTNPLPGVVMLSGTTDKQLTINFKYYLGTPPPAAAGSGQANGSGQTGHPVQAAPAASGEAAVPASPQVPPGAFRAGSANPLASGRPISPPARRDDKALKTAFQTPPAPIGDPSSLLQGLQGAVNGSTLTNLANLTGDLNLANAAGLPAPNPQTAALINALAARKANIPAVVVVPHAAPTINVQVPVNNMMNPSKAERSSLFHRRSKQNATPQNPIRPPLLERLRGNP